MVWNIVVITLLIVILILLLFIFSAVKLSGMEDLYWERLNRHDESNYEELELLDEMHQEKIRRLSYQLRIQNALQYKGSNAHEEVDSILLEFENEIIESILKDNTHALDAKRKALKSDFSYEVSKNVEQEIDMEVKK